MRTHTIDDEWTDCPMGTLNAIAVEIKRTSEIESRRKFLHGITAGVMVGGIGLGAAELWQRQKPAGNLTCVECMELFQAFARKELHSSFSHRVELHLAKCPSCRSHFEQQFA